MSDDLSFGFVPPPRSGSDHTPNRYGPPPPPQGPPPERWGSPRGYLFGAELAGWHLRVVAALIDFVVTLYLPGRLMMSLGIAPDVVAMVQVTLVIWNSCVEQGRSGQSVGKRVLGIQLVRPVMRRTGRFATYPGVGRSLYRLFAHVLDVPFLPLSIGGLRPLWHWHRQTFADTAAHTVVLRHAIELVPGLHDDSNLI